MAGTTFLVSIKREPRIRRKFTRPCREWGLGWDWNQCALLTPTLPNNPRQWGYVRRKPIITLSLRHAHYKWTRNTFIGFLGSNSFSRNASVSKIIVTSDIGFLLMPLLDTEVRVSITIIWVIISVIYSIILLYYRWIKVPWTSTHYVEQYLFYFHPNVVHNYISPLT